MLQEKDPNAPKRPLTAFFIFSKESRDQVGVGCGVCVLRRWLDGGPAARASRLADAAAVLVPAPPTRVLHSLPQFKEDNPQTKPSDISKLMGEAWKELSDEEKKPYVDKAAKLKVRGGGGAQHAVLLR
jgi:hypothetical protein